MKLKIDTRFSAEQIAVRANWILVISAGFLGYGHIDSSTAIAMAGILVLANGVAYRACSNRDSYIARGATICTAIRLIYAVVFACSIASNLWLLSICSIVLEAFVNRNKKRTMSLTASAILTCIGSAVIHHRFDVQAFVPAVGIGFGVGAGLWLIKFMSQNEQLSAASRRLNSLLQCGTELAASSELSATMSDTLKFAVHETKASCGYIMLLDDQKKDLLVTETAYGIEGEFTFPEQLEVGVGISGQVAKLGQPISVSGSGSEHNEFDATTPGVKAAASIPLSVRTYTKAGQAAVEQILGVMTLLDLETTDSFADDDMELLRTLGSLVSVAVSNARMEERRRTTFLLTLESLATALEARDEYTRGHSQRVCEVSLMIGENLGFGAEAMEELRIGTILHDIGKIGVPDAILNKRARLTDDEFEFMKNHPVIGYEICKPLMLSEGVLMIIRNHHEKLDGSGYPDGLKGGELPLSLRIVCAADAFDAMSSRRPYRNVMDANMVLAELSKGAGSQFDPVVVEHLKSLMQTDRLLDLYRAHWGDVELKVA
ncbi:MAG TPA: HD domain-containing phosphohydrolase [Fimbriimonadaceae bacterium]|jgi:putative nucleotidyltransferase with HDIG domain